MAKKKPQSPPKMPGVEAKDQVLVKLYLPVTIRNRLAGLAMDQGVNMNVAAAAVFDKHLPRWEMFIPRAKK